MRIYKTLLVASGLVLGASGAVVMADEGQHSEKHRVDTHESTAAPDERPVQPATPETAQEPTERKPARSGAAEEAGVDIKTLATEQVKQLQVKLESLGHYHGEIDGLFGPMMKRAMQQFYSEQAALARDGMISSEGAAALGIDVVEQHIEIDDPATASNDRR